MTASPSTFRFSTGSPGRMGSAGMPQHSPKLRHQQRRFHGYNRLARSVGVWRSSVARFVRDEEVPGSNPGTPTIFRKTKSPSWEITNWGFFCGRFCSNWTPILYSTDFFPASVLPLVRLFTQPAHKIRENPMAATRSVHAVWNGDLMAGSGVVSATTSKTFNDLSVSWKARTEEPGGST